MVAVVRADGLGRRIAEIADREPQDNGASDRWRPERIPVIAGVDNRNKVEWLSDLISAIRNIRWDTMPQGRTYWANVTNEMEKVRDYVESELRVREEEDADDLPETPQEGQPIVRQEGALGAAIGNPNIAIGNNNVLPNILTMNANEWLLRQEEPPRRRAAVWNDGTHMFQVIPEPPQPEQPPVEQANQAAEAARTYIQELREELDRRTRAQ